MSHVKKKHVSVMSYLNQIGVDINKPRIDGTTPFILACSTGDENIVKKLREFGVDMSKKKKIKMEKVHWI